MKTDEKKRKDQGRRKYGFLLYEESMKKDCIKFLNENQNMYVLSPWHDSDVNENGELKKKHRHGYIYYSGNRTQQFMDLYFIPNTGAVLLPQEINDEKAFIRYFIHKDNHEKAQYDIKDLIIGGNPDFKAKILHYFEDTPKTQYNKYVSSSKELFIKIKEILKQKECTDLFTLCEYILDLNDDELFEAISIRNSLVEKWLKGMYLKTYKENYTDENKKMFREIINSNNETQELLKTCIKEVKKSDDELKRTRNEVMKTPIRRKQMSVDTINTLARAENNITKLYNIIEEHEQKNVF